MVAPPSGGGLPATPRRGCGAPNLRNAEDCCSGPCTSGPGAARMRARKPGPLAAQVAPGKSTPMATSKSTAISTIVTPPGQAAAAGDVASHHLSARTKCRAQSRTRAPPVWRRRTAGKSIGTSKHRPGVVDAQVHGPRAKSATAAAWATEGSPPTAGPPALGAA